MKNFWIILCVSCIMFSCEKSHPENNSISVFIAGLTFGECLGDCHHFYKLENGELYADDCNFCMLPEDINFQSNPINNMQDLTLMAELKDEIPDFLLETEARVFGCPDCGDWGAVHVIIKREGVLDHFILDNNIEGNPPELREYALAVRETIWELNN